MQAPIDRIRAVSLRRRLHTAHLLSYLCVQGLIVSAHLFEPGDVKGRALSNASPCRQ
jgi:hypothetical protein